MKDLRGVSVSGRRVLLLTLLTFISVVSGLRGKNMKNVLNSIKGKNHEGFFQSFQQWGQPYTRITENMEGIHFLENWPIQGVVKITSNHKEMREFSVALSGTTIKFDTGAKIVMQDQKPVTTELKGLEEGGFIILLKKVETLGKSGDSLIHVVANFADGPDTYAQTEFDITIPAKAAAKKGFAAITTSFPESLITFDAQFYTTFKSDANPLITESMSLAEIGLGESKTFECPENKGIVIKKVFYDTVDSHVSAENLVTEQGQAIADVCNHFRFCSITINSSDKIDGDVIGMNDSDENKKAFIYYSCGEVVNAQVGDFTEWTECSVSCGKHGTAGEQMRTREAIQTAKNGGLTLGDQRIEKEESTICYTTFACGCFIERAQYYGTPHIDSKAVKNIYECAEMCKETEPTSLCNYQAHNSTCYIKSHEIFDADKIEESCVGMARDCVGDTSIKDLEIPFNKNMEIECESQTTIKILVANWTTGTSTKGGIKSNQVGEMCDGKTRCDVEASEKNFGGKDDHSLKVFYSCMDQDSADATYTPWSKWTACEKEGRDIEQTRKRAKGDAAIGKGKTWDELKLPLEEKKTCGGLEFYATGGFEAGVAFSYGDIKQPDGELHVLTKDLHACWVHIMHSGQATKNYAYNTKSKRCYAKTTDNTIHVIRDVTSSTFVGTVSRCFFAFAKIENGQGAQKSEKSKMLLDCQEECTKSETCNYWTFINEERSCWLYSNGKIVSGSQGETSGPGACQKKNEIFRLVTSNQAASIYVPNDYRLYILDATVGKKTVLEGSEDNANSVKAVATDFQGKYGGRQSDIKFAKDATSVRPDNVDEKDIEFEIIYLVVRRPHEYMTLAEYSTQEIKCNENEKIQIISQIWGDPKSVDGTSLSNIFVDITKAWDQCHNQQKCTVEATNNGVWGLQDPYVGIRKLHRLHYKCVDKTFEYARKEW